MPVVEQPIPPQLDRLSLTSKSDSLTLRSDSLAHQSLPPRPTAEIISDSTWDAPPTFGGTWGQFFKTFEGRENGLSRQEIFDLCPGNPDIFPHVFQYVLKEAIDDGLLISKELSEESVVRSGGRDAILRNSCERIFLNDRSERLRELMSEERVLDSAKIISFQAIDFTSIAQKSDCALIDPTNYAARFLSQLPNLGENGIIFLTHFYKSSEISPNPEACYGPGIRDFLDQVVLKAVDLGILNEEDIQGRPGYKLPLQIREECRNITITS